MFFQPIEFWHKNDLKVGDDFIFYFFLFENSDMKKIKIPKIDDLRRENSNISNVSNFWREKYPDFNLEIWQKLKKKITI